MNKLTSKRKEKDTLKTSGWASSFSLSSAANRHVQSRALKEAGDKLRQVISEVKKDANRLAGHR